ncbi:MAG: hydroxyacid dehydrogenase [Caulobacter sp.]|nr:hydroxyacid dehydrogenase [Caulobacter sp.]
MDGKPRILLNSPSLKGLRRRLDESFETVALWEYPDIAALRAAPGGVPRAMLAGGGVRRRHFDELPGLELIVSFGSGYDGIDLELARERGIQVANCPGANSADVADHALALMLSLVKNVISGDRLVRDGGWTAAHRGGVSGSLRGLKVGVLGLGTIGRLAADRLKAFGCDIAWWGPRPKETPYRRAEGLLALATESDVLLVTLRADHGNTGVIDQAVIEALGPRGCLINVARGLAVDEDALIAALKDGRLGCAGLDVFESEPTPAARWAEVPNVVLTPHSGGNTRAALLATLDLAKANFDAFFAGRPILTPVPEMADG